MTRNPAIKPPIAIPSGDRLRVTTYDSGYEHSLEHWLEVQQLVEAADQQSGAQKALSKAKAS